MAASEILASSGKHRVVCDIVARGPPRDERRRDGWDARSTHEKDTVVDRRTVGLHLIVMTLIYYDNGDLADWI